MTTFKEQEAIDLAVFYNTDEMAKEVTYSPKDGQAKTVTIIPGSRKGTLQDPIAPADTMVIWVQTADVENPQFEDQFSIDGEIWYFSENLSGGGDDLEWELEISRSKRRGL